MLFNNPQSALGACSRPPALLNSVRNFLTTPEEQS